MKSILIKILMMLVCVCLALCLFACNGDTPDNGGNTDDNGGNTDGDNTDGGNTDGGNTDGGNTDGEIDWDNTGLEGLALIYNGKARFQVVYTAESGAKALEIAQTFVDRLRELKIEVADPVPDTDAAKVADCEIIIGLNAQNRDSELNIGYRDLGPNGYAIKTVGTKILIAGGTDVRLEDTYRNYLRDQMGIKSSTKKLKDVAVDATYNVVAPTEHDITYIRVGAEDLSSYTLFIDVAGVGEYSTASIDSFREDLFSKTGYWLELGNNADMDAAEHKMIIRYSNAIASEYAEYGFAACVDANKDLIIECSYANALDKHFATFANKAIFGKMDGITFTSDYSYTSYASRAYYSEFGAIGDGIVDDYEAMYDTHVYANQCGQTVYADAGKSYYVHVFHNGSLPVKTNVYLGDANILINDTGTEVYAQRSKPLYSINKDSDVVSYNKNQIKEQFGAVTLAVGQENIPWLKGVLVADSLIRFTNDNHKDFVRKGGNQDSGYSRQDVVVVDVNGNVDPTTPIIFEFKQITAIRISRNDDAPIVFDGGNFITTCCRVTADTDFVNKYHSYQRGINVNRSNALITNVTHRMVEEPEYDASVERYGRGSDGKLSQSYPYHAFLQYNNAYNSHASNMDLTGHATYYEDKATSTNPVPMGSYDFVLGSSIKINFTNVVQNGVDITDSKYWGIMASNGVKNISFVDCEISRFDAHRGFWNGTLINTTIGHTINVIGGGLMTCTNVTKLTGNQFMGLRSDYGATFEGDMHLTDCKLEGYKSYDSRTGAFLDRTPGYTSAVIINSGYGSSDDTYLTWDFGFTCYMPQNLIIDNFQSGIADISVFNDILNAAFNPENSNCYVITKSITFKNMKTLPITPSSACTELRGVPVVNETEGNVAGEEK